MAWLVLIGFFSVVAFIAWALLRVGAKADQIQEQAMIQWERDLNRRGICHN
jgi:hypothetical protein